MSKIHSEWAVIFDLDGTLVDSEPIHFKAHQIGLKEKAGVELTLDFYKANGVSTDWWVFYKKAGVHDEAILKEVHDHKLVVFEELLDTMLSPMENVKKALEQLRQSGLLLGVASSTNEKMIRKILSDTKLIDLFDVILSGQSVPKNKPAPDCFLKVSEIMEIDPKNCIGVEDSLNGLLSLNNAKMHTVFIKNDFNKNIDYKKYAGKVFENYDELPGLVEIIINEQ